MTVRRIARCVGAMAVMIAAVPFGTAAPTASAQPCPDIDVVFARGTGEPPGVGATGQAFVDALRAQAGGRTVAVSPVIYPASSNFGDRIAFAKTVVDGVRDAGSHIEAVARDCPDTRVVIGGFSQGAAVAGFVTSDAVPDGVPDEYLSYIPNPMPDSVADHVAAVVLFGTPSDEFLGRFGAPLVTIGPMYTDKTLELCAPGDTICDGAPGGIPSMAHTLYPVNGMAHEAAAYVVGRLA